MEPKKGPCPTCDGNTKDPDNPTNDCPTCNGEGWIEVYPDIGDK